MTRKLQYRGKLGIHNVYSTPHGTYALTQYRNVTELHPVKKVKGFGWNVTGERKIIKNIGYRQYNMTDKELTRSLKKTELFAKNLLKHGHHGGLKL